MMKNTWIKTKKKINQIANLENFAYLIIFCIPLYLVRVDFFSLPTNLLEILIVIFLILSLTNEINRVNLIIFSKKNKKYLFGFSIILLGLLISTLVNENIWKSLGIIKGWFVLPFLFCFVAVSIIPREKRNNFFKAYFYSALAVSVLGLIFVAADKLTYDNRLTAIFNSPNYLAMYLAPALMVGFFLFQKNGWWYFSLIVISIALLLTYSYLAWAALIAVAIVVALGASKLAARAFIVSLMGLVLIFFIMVVQTQKIADLKNFSKRSSLSSRIMIWKSANRMLSENWFFGIGPSNFQEKYLQNQKYYPPYLEWAVPHPHSVYLSFWLYSGFLGFLAFITMLFWWFLGFIKNKKRETLLGIVSLSIVLYFLIHGLADSTYFKNDLSVLFWLAFFSLL